jgi:hypothetical protein
MMLTRLTVKADAAATTPAGKGDVIAQMRTVISAGYETVSAVAAVSLTTMIPTQLCSNS